MRPRLGLGTSSPLSLFWLRLPALVLPFVLRPAVFFFCFFHTPGHFPTHFSRFSTCWLIHFIERTRLTRRRSSVIYFMNELGISFIRAKAKYYDWKDQKKKKEGRRIRGHESAYTYIFIHPRTCNGMQEDMRFRLWRIPADVFLVLGCQLKCHRQANVRVPTTKPDDPV